ncbi:MAG: hypothetical protein CME33_18150 [Gimesia sp.]|nr:hypothetical protein [Gimesia sp.]
MPPIGLSDGAEQVWKACFRMAAATSCSLRSPRIAFGVTLFKLRVVRDFHLRGLGRFFYNALGNMHGDVNTSTVGQADNWHALF